MVHFSWTFLLTTHNQYWTNVLILMNVLGSHISWSFLFPFIIQLILEDHNHLYIQPLFHRHFLQIWFDFRLYVLRLIWIIYTLVKKTVGNNCVSSKYEWSITSYIGLQNGFFYWQHFQCLHSLFLDIKNYSYLLLF